jgi:hypothetical protein
MHAGRILAGCARGAIRPDLRQFMLLLSEVKVMEGGFYCSSENARAVEPLLDRVYVREHGERIWAPRYGAARNPQELDFRGVVAVVGKGPDLDLLSAAHLQGCHSVICVNDSIHAVERLPLSIPAYAIQTDSILEDRCRPRNGSLLVSICVAHKYREFGEKFVFRLNDYDIDRICTAGFAVAIARSGGATGFRMFAFNAIVEGNYSYARVIGGKPPNTEYWRLHKAVIEKAASGVPIEWVKL